MRNELARDVCDLQMLGMVLDAPLEMHTAECLPKHTAVTTKLSLPRCNTVTSRSCEPAAIHYRHHTKLRACRDAISSPRKTESLPRCTTVTPQSCEPAAMRHTPKLQACRDAPHKTASLPRCIPVTTQSCEPAFGALVSSPR